jgi:hypothetical protein
MQRLAFVFFCACLCAALNASSQELLFNPGYESGSLSSWSTDWTPGSAGALITTTAAHSGSHGLWEYTANTAASSFSGTYQQVAASVGQSFQAGAWVRTTPVSGGGSWVTGGAAFLRVSFIASGGSPIAAYDSTQLTTASSGWQLLTVQTPPAPAGTAYVRLITRVEKSAAASGQAVANFDDCTLTRVVSPPVLSVSKQVISFGVSATSATLDINNSGAGTLHWQSAEDAPWLVLSASSGDTTSETDTITLTAVRTGLSLESYHATLSFTSDGGSKSVDVYLETPRSYSVPTQPSIVTTSGYQILVRRRLPGNVLDSPHAYTIKGAAWSPADKDTANSRAAPLMV